MTTWATESDVHSFFNVVPPCGRGKSLKVLQYLQQKGISSTSCTSSVSSSCSGSDAEDGMYPPSARSPPKCAGRGMVLKNYDKNSFFGLQGERERWDEAVFSQLRRANRQSYTTEAFENQLRLLHKAQEEKEKLGQFDDTICDDPSSAGTSESVANSLSPSLDSLCSLPTSLEEEFEDKTKKVNLTEDLVPQSKPVYKSVRSRNVLLNSLAKMTVTKNSVQEPVSDHFETECNSHAFGSSVVTSDDSSGVSPLIFDSAACSPQPDLHEQNVVLNPDINGLTQGNSIIPLTNQEVTNDNQLLLNENNIDNSIPFNCDGISNDTNMCSNASFKNNIDYPSVVGQYYDSHYADILVVKSNDTGLVFKDNSKSYKFSPPSLVGLESLNFSTKLGSECNTKFELKSEDFPPLQ